MADTCSLCEYFEPMPGSHVCKGCDEARRKQLVEAPPSGFEVMKEAFTRASNAQRAVDIIIADAKKKGGAR